MIDQAKALEKGAKLLAKQHADETDRIRKQQAEDKRALVEARSRILKQKAAEEEQKLMAERLRKDGGRKYALEADGDGPHKAEKRFRSRT